MDESGVQEDPERQRTSRQADGGQREKEEREREEVVRVVPAIARHPRVVQVASKVMESRQVGQLHVVYISLHLLPAADGAKERERELGRAQSVCEYGVRRALALAR